MVDLDQPIHEDGAHGPLNLGLIIHIVRVRKHLDLLARIVSKGSA